MLWGHYVYKRGDAVLELWDQLFRRRPVRLLYIAGRGFDPRVRVVMQQFLAAMKMGDHTIEQAKLLLVAFTDYELDEHLEQQTNLNATELERMFEDIGSSDQVTIGTSAGGETDISASNALRLGTESVLRYVTDQTDIILDVSTLPRVAYLAIMTGILQRLVPDKGAERALRAGGVNFQVVVAEDAHLDSQIRSEDPSNDLVLIPGFSSALHAESVQEWPLVWFPILGENRLGQLEKVLATAIPDSAEICPVVPHPSQDPRRAERLLVEYRRPLFDARGTPTTNILYAHEGHPFEAYRQLVKAMRRYCDSLRLIGGCRLVVTPLASKLITIGAGLACFEMRPPNMESNFGVAIPYAEPSRYVVPSEALLKTKPELSTVLLTGVAYE